MTNAELDRLALEVGGRQGQVMLRQVEAFLGRFVSYPDQHAQMAHTLWVVHCHLMHLWESTPRLAFLSPEPGSGKTRALEITKLLVPNPVIAINVSPAYLFRKVGDEAAGLPTILFDEIDTVFGPKAKDNEDIRGLLNAGHRKGAGAGRCVVRGATVVTEEIPAYCAVAVAGLGWLPDTLLSRSIVIRMRPRHAGEKVDPYRPRLHDVEGGTICRSIEAWASNLTEVIWPELPPEIQDRDADCWEPLIAVADAAGGSWPARARAAAVALVAGGQDREASLGIRLLADLQLIFDGVDKLSSKMILHRLIEIEESPWGDIRGKPLDERGLAHRLRQYSIRSANIQIGDSRPKGYRRSDFIDAWTRYLPTPAAKSATDATPLQPEPGCSAGAHVADFPEAEGPDPDDYSFNLED
jgi:Protein of unknown function (DUF3631)